MRDVLGIICICCCCRRRKAAGDENEPAPNPRRAGGCCRRSNVDAARKAEPAPRAEQLVFYTAECSVCMERFAEGQKVVRLNCGHLFHDECIRLWLSVRDACPLCNSNNARKAMKSLQVALVNDPERLGELNLYIQQGVVPIITLYNFVLLMTEEGRKVLLEIAIRRRLFGSSVVLQRLDRCPFLMSTVVCIVASALAIIANAFLQVGLELAFYAVDLDFILNGAQNFGSRVTSPFLLAIWVPLLLMGIIGYRARSISPAPLSGDFHPENIYAIPGEQVGQPTNEDVKEVGNTHSESIVASPPVASLIKSPMDQTNENANAVETALSLVKSEDISFGTSDHVGQPMNEEVKEVKNIHSANIVASPPVASLIKSPMDQTNENANAVETALSLVNSEDIWFEALDQ